MKCLHREIENGEWEMEREVRIVREFEKMETLFTISLLPLAIKKAKPCL